MKKVIAIIGARPQFIKHFPLEKAAAGKIELITIHTGQHYDDNMSKVFFDQLGMSKPKYQLAIGSSAHGAQTGRMMEAIEEIVVKEAADAVLVYGDTNSTLAGALVAAKLNIPIYHIEAGLRSYNKSMPEEINRVLTDHISTYLFVPSSEAISNLAKEGITAGVIEVGDIMKDLILYSIDKDLVVKPLGITESYYFATLHRPYNTDDKARLTEVLLSLNGLNRKVIFAIHPRTRKAMMTFGMESQGFGNIVFINPQPYFENLGYLYHSEGLITDSGGMQKEAYWMKKKCVTVRTETEWVETLHDNANTLIFDDLSGINTLFMSEKPHFEDHLYGDGSAARQIIDNIL